MQEAGEKSTRALWVRRAAGVVLPALTATLLALGPVGAGDGNGEEDPPYPHGEFSEDCSLCHREDAWVPAVISRDFRHAAGFPLVDAHGKASCRACHVSLEFKRVGSSCVDCHLDVHRGELGIDCARCHTTRSFIDRSAAARNHRTTQFPLTGAHSIADCEACHTLAPAGKQTFVGLNNACEACHAAPGFPLAQQRPPDHDAQGFARDCSRCHSTVSFDNPRIDHDLTGFPLTGAHRGLDCARCHGNPFNGDLDPDCVACHRSDYDRATDPPHKTAGFPTDCTLCHTTTTFDPSTFDHGTSDFPLTGSHVGLSCNACHADGVYDGKNTACVSCHQADYDRTTDPNHRAAGFSTDCTQCHTTTSFDGANFDHRGTDFPLTGSHVGLNCNACHADGVYAGKSAECVACHQADYDRTTDPNHRAAGFPTDCTLCHTTMTFDGADFDHGTSSFPLTGSHVGLNCNACHADGVYDGKPTDCYSCHRSDYDGVRDPNHVAANFSRDCTLCHTTTTFSGARYSEHDAAYFPIYTGKHRGRWEGCSDCHTVSSNYAQFSCFLCHSKSETDSDHRDTPGYAYDSAACYSCHPRGEAD